MLNRVIDKSLSQGAVQVERVGKYKLSYTWNSAVYIELPDGTRTTRDSVVEAFEFIEQESGEKVNPELPE